MADNIDTPTIRPCPHYDVTLIDRHRLSDQCVEIVLSRPPGFDFIPGQSLCILSGDTARHYSLASGPGDEDIRLCVRLIAGGGLSPRLASAPTGSHWSITGPHGYFILRPTVRPVIFVATGSGIAPFVSMTASGARPAALLHGVRRSAELYYRSQFAPLGAAYTPCISTAASGQSADPNIFRGRVTSFLQNRLPSGVYDFYLCGNQRMVRDATLLIDDRFSGSYVFTEVFF